jgi:glucose 1-dehydrogenase
VPLDFRAAGLYARLAGRACAQFFERESGSVLSPYRLLDKFVLITGASRGIGRAVAIRCAEEGSSVAVNHYRDDTAAAETLAALAEASHREGHGARLHCTIEADVGDAVAVGGLFADLLARLPRLDILINNAGIQAPTPGDDFDDAQFARILAVNLTGAALCARHALRQFLAQGGGGIIINTTSVHEIVPKPGYLAYSLAKGGLGNLTRTLALEFAAHGIRVNAVGPGAVTTDMNAAWIHDAAARAMVESHIPLGRAATAEELAPVFAFLASEEARYITGQTLFACGGLTLFADFKSNWAS